MAEKKNEITLSGFFITELDNLGNSLPENFNKERFAHNAVALINDKPELQKFGKEQLASGLIRGALSGLDFYSGEAYLIPYNGKLQYMPSYKGVKKMAMQHSARPIKDIYAKVIREGDEFVEEIVHGEPSISFKPLFMNKGEIIGSFAVCLYQDGTMVYEVMSIDDIEACRKQSKAANSPAWKNFFSEMARKCAMNRLCKNITLEWDNPSQQKDFIAGMEIETDAKAQVQADIQENANKQEFNTEDAIEIDENGQMIL